MAGDKKEPISAVISDPDESGDWDVVRDSWVHPDSADLLLPAGVEPSSSGKTGAAGSSLPPPLASADVIAAMFDCLLRDDYEGTLIAARAALSVRPTNEDALQCREMAHNALTKRYRGRLGIVAGQRAVPKRTGARGDLDPRARPVLDAVDDTASMSEIIEKLNLPPPDALRFLSELLLAGVIEVVCEPATE